VLTVALVGCGKVAQSHVEEIGKRKDARLVAVCDSELLMAEQIAVRHKIPSYYDDFGRMLDEQRPDIVHITTPPQSHLELALRSLEAGCHLFIEKPLAPSYSECLRVIAAALRARRKLTTGLCYAFDPTFRELECGVRGGVVGDVVHVESYFGYDMSSRFARAALTNEHHWLHDLSGTLVRNVLDHPVFAVVRLFPNEDLEIRSTSRRLRPSCGVRALDSIADELRVTITGRRTSAFVTFSSHARPISHFVTVYGTRGTKQADYIARSIVRRRNSILPTPIAKVVVPVSYARQYLRQGMRNLARFAGSECQFNAGFSFLLSAFYGSVLRGSALPISYEEILRVSRVVDTICRGISDADEAWQQVSSTVVAPSCLELADLFTTCER